MVQISLKFANCILNCAARADVHYSRIHPASKFTSLKDNDKSEVVVSQSLVQLHTPWDHTKYLQGVLKLPTKKHFHELMS